MVFLSGWPHKKIKGAVLRIYDFRGFLQSHITPYILWRILRKERLLRNLVTENIQQIVAVALLKYQQKKP